MELWMKIGSAVLLGMMLIFLYPRMRQMLEESREKPTDWGGALLPIGAVVLFILLLMSAV